MTHPETFGTLIYQDNALLVTYLNPYSILVPKYSSILVYRNPQPYSELGS